MSHQDRRGQTQRRGATLCPARILGLTVFCLASPLSAFAAPFSEPPSGVLPPSDPVKKLSDPPDDAPVGKPREGASLREILVQQRTGKRQLVSDFHSLSAAMADQRQAKDGVLPSLAKGRETVPVFQETTEPIGPAYSGEGVRIGLSLEAILDEPEEERSDAEGTEVAAVVREPQPIEAIPSQAIPPETYSSETEQSASAEMGGAEVKGMGALSALPASNDEATKSVFLPESERAGDRPDSAPVEDFTEPVAPPQANRQDPGKAPVVAVNPANQSGIQSGIRRRLPLIDRDWMAVSWISSKELINTDWLAPLQAAEPMIQAPLRPLLALAGELERGSLSAADRAARVDARAEKNALVGSGGGHATIAQAPATGNPSEVVGKRQPPAEENNAQIEFDFDDPPDAVHRLTPTLSYGGKLALEASHLRDQDLDSEVDDRSTPIEPSLELTFAYTPKKNVLGFVELEIERTYDLDDANGEPELTIDQANFTFREFKPGWSLQIGRQSFEDEREWLYDEKLDAIRLFYRYKRLGLEVSFSREDLVDRDLLNHDDPDRINNFFLVGHYAFNKDHYLGGYLLRRDDRSDDDEDLIFLGVRAAGETDSDIAYWLDAARLGGNDEEDKLRGYGLDAGVTYEFDGPSRFSLTLAGAMGSGDSNGSDDVDRDFRQTGLEGNDGKFNGVASFKYYGEVLDPELRNLQIFTLGAGVRPSKQWSLDLVYHRYWQHRADDRLRGSDLDIDPDGVHRELGQGLDLIFGYRNKKRKFNAQVTLGVFDPGDAFAPDADPAYFGELKLSRKF